jgi:hypothetical protein
VRQAGYQKSEGDVVLAAEELVGGGLGTNLHGEEEAEAEHGDEEQSHLHAVRPHVTQQRRISR